MKRYLFIPLFFLSVNLSSQDFGGDYFVATDGNDNGPGTIDQPWATWQKAFNEARPGDTVYFRGGVYYSTGRKEINPEKHGGPVGASGTRENPISYMGYPPDVMNGNMPILDCSNHCGNAEPGFYNQAIQIQYAEHLVFKDLEIKNVFQCESVLSGAITATYSRNLTFEHIVMHQIGQRGFYMEGGAWITHYEDGDTDVMPYWPDQYDTTRFINCDVYNLCDSITNAGGFDPGNGADGFKTIHYRGNHVEWIGCRIWNYTDDGIDPSLINGGTILIDNCWLMGGGEYAVFDHDGFTRANEQNGCKLNGRPIAGVASSTDGGIVANSLAMFCRGSGFGVMNQEDERGGHKYYNNTSYKNGYCFSSDNESTVDYPSPYVYRNNIAYSALNTTAGGQNYIVALRGEAGAEITESNNTWDFDHGYPGFVVTDTVTVNDADFETVDSLELISLFTAPRNSDGSLPKFPLSLVRGSDLIDAGTDVGFPYKGSAPDIGAFELGSITVELVAPEDNQEYTEGDVVEISALAVESEDVVTNVAFYLNNKEKMIGNGTSVGQNVWEFSWNSDTIGVQRITAVATNSLGDFATSTEKKITIFPEDVPSEESNCEIRYHPEMNLYRLALNEPQTETTGFQIINVNGKIESIETIEKDLFYKDYEFSDLQSGMYIIQFIVESDQTVCTEPIRFIKY